MIERYQRKVRDQSPKIRNPASRLPKELVRSAMLETKEKTSIMADKIGRETGEESPVEYAWKPDRTSGTAGWERKRFCSLSWRKEAGSENL